MRFGDQGRNIKSPLGDLGAKEAEGAKGVAFARKCASAIKSGMAEGQKGIP